MTVHIEQRTSRLAGWSRLTAYFAAVLLLVAGAAHRFGLLQTGDFLSVLALTAALAVLALVFASLSFRRVWTRGDLGAADIAKGTLVGLAVLAPFGLALFWGLTRPPLNDVSTDTVDPPRFVRAVGDRTFGMNPIRPIGGASARLQAEAYPEVTGRRYAAPDDRVLATVLNLIERHSWRLLSDPRGELDDPEVTVEALARTFILGFPSDVAIRVTDEGGTTYVDMRSASRYGNRDLGDNAERVAGFLGELDAEMATQAGAPPAE
ncbi:MAG: DUF1499 domain-containing protein [Mesorhizobium sp.]